MAIQTAGFIPRSGVLPSFTPVDPRLAVADPASLLQGLNSGMAQTRLLQADQYARELAPFQQQLAMAQAQQQIAALPQQEKLRQFSFDAAQRQDTLARLQPFEVLGNKFIDTDPESGALAEFQEVKTLDPATGQLVGSTAKLSRVLETKAQAEQEARLNASTAANKDAQTQKYLAEAEKAMRDVATPQTGNKPGQVVMNTALGREIIWAARPQNWIDSKTGLPVYNLTVDPKNPLGEPTVLTKNPDVWPKADETKKTGTGGADEIDSFGASGAQTQDPFAATVTGTSVPNVEMIPPQFAFQSEDAVNQAAANGLLQDGQAIMVNGVRAHWRTGP